MQEIYSELIKLAAEMFRHENGQSCPYYEFSGVRYRNRRSKGVMQVMPTREELRKNIDTALYSALLTHYGNSRDVDEELCGELAEVALQSILSSLPVPVSGYMNKHDIYYRDLMEMKKNG